MASLTLPISTDDFPFHILGLAYFTRASLQTDIRFDTDVAKPSLKSGGNTLTSEKDIVKALSCKLPIARDPIPELALTGHYDQLREQLQGLDSHLVIRTFFAADDITSSDWVIWGALRGSVKVMGLSKNGEFPHLLRWFSFLEGLESTSEALAKLNSARRYALRETASGDAASFDLYLKDAVQGRVETRFPPEPSGYLHIGHIKAAMLNDYFARRYHGKLIIRFDDTNPTKEKEEYEQAILSDLDELWIRGDIVSHSSDYFPQLYSFAVQMIRDGKAYVDDTEKTIMGAERWRGLASANRERSIKDNLSLFEAMKSGTEIGRRCCLRAKISVDDPNKAMRDPVIYRCIDSTHPRTGSTWKIFPTYDFACPVIDSLEGVTHALRSNEYRDRNAQYHWILNTLGLRSVLVWDFSRLNFVYTPLSKRVFRDCLDNGLVSGWDDPRLPTFQGIRRRGMTVEALRRFMLPQGPSQNQILLEWDSIWALNKKIIDPVAPRFFAILNENFVRTSVRGIERHDVKLVPKHRNVPQLGCRPIVKFSHIIIEQEDAKLLKLGDEIVLMDWGFAVVYSILKQNDGIVTDMVVDLRVDGDVKRSRKITWLPDPEVRLDLEGIDRLVIPIALLDYDYLITKPKLKKGEKIADWSNPRTEFHESAWVEGEVSTLRKGTIVQFERKGYYVVDSEFDSRLQNVMKFISVPDGKARSLTPKSEFLV